MSVEENKVIARRWNEEVFNNNNFDVRDELAAENYVNYFGNDNIDLEGHKKTMMELLDAFSDGGIVIEDLFAEGDKVVVRWKMYGTHTGEYMGVPPTGKVISNRGISIYRIENGKIVEDWACQDMVGAMQQLGLLPTA